MITFDSFKNFFEHIEKSNGHYYVDRISEGEKIQGFYNEPITYFLFRNRFSEIQTKNYNFEIANKNVCECSLHDGVYTIVCHNSAYPCRYYIYKSKVRARTVFINQNGKLEEVYCFGSHINSCEYFF